MAPSLPAPVDLGDLLEPFARRGVDLGLDRLKAALAEGGDPQNAFAAVQVAGTNGKGSIATQLHAILRAAAVASACYRSPHLVSWCERLELGDAWITPELSRSSGRGWPGSTTVMRSPAATTSPPSNCSPPRPSTAVPPRASNWRCWRWASGAGWTPPPPTPIGVWWASA